MEKRLRWMGHWIVISIRRMPRKECKKGIIVMTIHRKKRIYISGPMRGKKESESREAFAEAQALLEASGCTAIDPWDIQEFLPNMTEEEYLLFDLFIVSTHASTSPSRLPTAGPGIAPSCWRPPR